MSDETKTAFDPKYGLTLREYAAIHICAGLVSNGEIDNTFAEDAELSVKQADALIAELERTK